MQIIAIANGKALQKNGGAPCTVQNLHKKTIGASRKRYMFHSARWKIRTARRAAFC